MWGGGGCISSSHRVGEGGGGLGRAPNIHHERMSPDPLACGQLIAVFLCGGGEYQGEGEGGLGRVPYVCVNRVILIMTHIWAYVAFGLMSHSG